MGQARDATSLLAYLNERRPAGATSWVVPRWQSKLSGGVFPFGATVDGRFIPIGTATLISGSGIVLSAWHNVHEAFNYAHNGDALRQMRELAGNHSLDGAGLSVLHSHHHTESGRLDVSIFSLWHANGAPPSDLMFGSLVQDAAGHPRLPLPVSFAVPRIGERVLCLGYGEMTYPEGGIDMDGIRRGSTDIVTRTKMDLHVVEGVVRRILTVRVAKGFGEGPCALVDCEVKHGQSGGPVLNEQGFVCGVVSSSFGSQSTVALLYPALLTEIHTRVLIGPVTMSANYPLLERVAHGEILSDGTETMHALTPHASGQWMVNPAILRKDGHAVHEDVHGLESETPLTPVEGPVWKLRVNENDSRPSD
jgi:hypothetical protein